MIIPITRSGYFGICLHVWWKCWNLQRPNRWRARALCFCHANQLMPALARKRPTGGCFVGVCGWLWVMCCCFRCLPSFGGGGVMLLPWKFTSINMVQSVHLFPVCRMAVASLVVYRTQSACIICCYVNGCLFVWCVCVCECIGVCSCCCSPICLCSSVRHRYIMYTCAKPYRCYVACWIMYDEVLRINYLRFHRLYSRLSSWSIRSKSLDGKTCWRTERPLPFERHMAKFQIEHVIKTLWLYFFFNS